MLRYTARNGTTFHLDPVCTSQIEVISADAEGAVTAMDLEDIREFIGFLDDQLDGLMIETDADLSAVGPD